MKLSEPGRIGEVEIRNRLVMAPMISNLANPDGCTNENHIAYLEERAKGGTGLIITEYTYVNGMNSRGSRNQAGAYNHDFIPKYRRLTERVHSHGAKVFMQLVHAGGKAFLDTNRKGPMAPTSTDYVGYTPREMTLDDIEGVKEDFLKAAKFVKDAQFDGIELHGAHGYLIQEFLSPTLNQRTDKYGGSFENRIRFPQEIAEAIRSEIGITTGIRLSLYEDDVGGYGPDYGLKVAETLKEIDYAHFSAGRFAPPGSSSSFYGNKVHIASRLPRKPNIATIVVGSVTQRADAEKALEKSDFVAVGRGVLADPYFATKLLNEPEVLRPCIRCNQACRDLGFGEVRCTVNPDLGMEALRKPNIMGKGELAIAGAGLKGLEAAILAAKSGFSVTLYDERDRIGGQLLDIFDVKKREEYSTLLDYYSNVLKRLNVRFVPGKKYTGKGLYCLPDIIYPDIEPGDTVRIDSNVYKYHDLALKLAEGHRVIMSERSLSSLDRVRRQSYLKMAQDAGITFTGDTSGKFDISINHRMQYDMREAMVAGREAFYRYVEENSTGAL